MNLHLGSSPDPKIHVVLPSHPLKLRRGIMRSRVGPSTISQMGIKLSPNFATLTHQLGRSWEPGHTHTKRWAWARAKEGTCSQPPGLELQTSAGEEQEGFSDWDRGLGARGIAVCRSFDVVEHSHRLRRGSLASRTQKLGTVTCLGSSLSVSSLRTRGIAGSAGERGTAPYRPTAEARNKEVSGGRGEARPWSLRLCVGGWSILEQIPAQTRQYRAINGAHKGTPELGSPLLWSSER